MNRHAFASMRHAIDPRGLTPGAIAHGAQVLAVALGAWVALGMAGRGFDDASAAGMAAATGVVALVAAPRQRSAEVLGAVAIWMTTCEFLAASRTGEFALWRWAIMLAALAMVLIAGWAMRLRGAARHNPWRPLRETRRVRPTAGPGLNWRHRAAQESDQIPAALADIEGRARALRG